jgi:HEPN domain-containing protein
MTPAEARSFLLLAREDLAVVGKLMGEHPRQAAFHLQQVAEKLIKAGLAAGGTAIPRTHQLGALVSLLPEDHPWRPDLMALDRLTSHATALRYPTAASGLPAAPPASRIMSDLADLAALVDSIETWADQRSEA